VDHTPKEFDMNERMRELSEQASKWVCENEPRAFDDTDLFYELMQAKFAELIVKECVQSIEKTIEINCDTDSEKMGCEFAITDLIEHFGVE
jgi:hypothetical protein